MQIHELNTFSGTPGDADFLATDNGTDTSKISAKNLLKGPNDKITNLQSNKVNQPLDDYNQPINGTNGQLLRTKGDGKTEWANEGLPTDAQTAQAVSDWLDDHPEATTTVQDGSLTEAKFSNPLKLKTINNYVSPEQYGAKGDGVTDDTQAWQDAVDSGYNVIATKSAYKCGQITVKKNIQINCNGASFLCTADKLFYCEGDVITTLTGEADYTANNPGYAITDADFSNYTGIAMLIGTNNFEKSRPYYRGGFVCEFYNGTMAGTFPIDVTGVSIDIIDPIKVDIYNIGDINQNVSANDYAITFKYGFGCSIRNSNIEHSGAYCVVLFDKCLNCIVDNCNILQSFTSADNNSYLVSFSNSSFCSVLNSYMYNMLWHCITTGDTYLCFHNMIDRCHLYTNSSYAFEDHENALNSIITNSVISGVGLSGMGVIDNCNIIAINVSPYNCLIRLLAMSNIETAIYNLSNIKLFPKTGSNSTYSGVRLVSSSRNPGTTYYIKNCNMVNVKNCNKDCQCEARFGFDTQSTNIVYNVALINCNLYIYLAKAGEAYIDISNYTLTLSDFNSFGYDNQYYPTIGGSSYEFNDVIFNNVKLHQVNGKYNRLHINGFWSRNGFASACTVTSELFGSLINSVIRTSTILSASLVRISDMRDSSAMLFNIGTGDNGNVYYQRYDNNGVIQTYQLS